MSTQSRDYHSPEALRAVVSGVLSAFTHPTLQQNLTTLKALRHVALLDEKLHIELVMPFIWRSAFEDLKAQVSAELLRLTQGSVVSLDGLAGEPLDILINGYLIAQGEVVVVNDKYGVRITDIITPSERMRRLSR